MQAAAECFLANVTAFQC